MFRSLIATCILAVALAVSAAPVSATTIVAVVNGTPITSYDVAQRQRLLTLTSGSRASQRAALDELIDEKIQLGAAKASRINVTDADVDKSIAEIATRVKLSPARLTQVLNQQGVQIGTLRDRLRAQIGFNRLVRARFDAFAKVSEQDLVAALLKDDSLEKTIEAAQYELEQVTVAMDENPTPAQLRDAQGRAADLRRRFSSCSEGVPMAKKTRNVVVRPFGRRMETDLTPDVRAALAETNVGKLSSPIQTPRGLVMFAVCDKTMMQSANAAMKALEPDMTSERGEAFQKQYLRQLRRDAVIERR